MSTQLVRGANTSLSEASPLLRAIQIQLSWPADAEAHVTVALLGLDHRLPGDDHVLPAHMLGGQGHQLSRGGDGFEIDLTSVPSELAAMAFLISTPDLAEPEQSSITRLHPLGVRIFNAVTAVELARYDVETPSSAETSLVLLEVYRRSGQWKARAVGQGSTGGLTALLRTYGGTDLPTSGLPATWVDTTFLRRRAAAPAPAAVDAATPPAMVDAAPAPAVVDKVSLEKSPQPRGDVPTTDVMASPPTEVRQTDDQADDADPPEAADASAPARWRAPDLLAAPVALSARTILNDRRPSLRVAPQQLGGGALDLTLTWVRPSASGQGASPARPSTDLHLGALWQLSSGLSGALQSLGGHRRGPVRGAAILQLGPHSEVEGETVTIDLERLADLHRVVLFVYSYSGRPQWQLHRPAVTATWANGAKVEARIDDAPPVATICAAVSIHRVGHTLVVRREAEFLRGQQSAVATAYGFDLGWSRGQVMPGR